MRYDQKQRAVTLPNGLCKFECDLTEQERIVRDQWLTKFGEPLIDPHVELVESTYPKHEYPTYENKSLQQKEQYLWCNTCKNSHEHIGFFCCGVSSDERPGLDVWQKVNCDLTIGEYGQTEKSVKTSCPWHEAKENRVLHNCKSCVRSSKHENNCWRLIQDSPVEYNPIQTWWYKRCAIYDMRGFDDRADNCPGWKERE